MSTHASGAKRRYRRKDVTVRDGKIDDAALLTLPARSDRRGSSIGVVIPLYNKEATLERCLQSVLRQTFQPKQIIVVDDQSIDKSFELARQLLAGVPGAQVVRQPVNGGPGKARNAGARLLDTDWLAFLDADDQWGTKFLEHMAAAVATTRSDFAGSGRVQIDPRRGGQEEFILSGYPPDGAIVLDGRFWTAFPDFYPLNSSCNLIATRLFREAGGFPELMRQREDHVLWARLWGRGRFCFINEPLAHIEKSSGGLSGSPPLFRDLIKMQQTLIGTFARALVSRRRGRMALARYVLVTGLKFSCHIVLRGVRAVIDRERKAQPARPL